MPICQRSAKLGGIITAVLLAVVAVGDEPPQPNAARPATTQPQLDPEVDRILTRLEQREVDDLRARLSWRKRDLLDFDEDVITKRGRIWYQDAEPVARFLIHFDAQISGTGRKDELDERHLFDGRWYVELQSRTKTYTKREIRREDEQWDPYEVGEGVFPLPFGQKKEAILREFTVERLPLGEKDPARTDRIRLTPRKGTPTAEDYRRLEFWVAEEGPLAGLPVKVEVLKNDPAGKASQTITIRFDDVQLNTGFSAGVFDLEPPAGYHVIEERLDPVPPPVGMGGAASPTE
jgi:hypothetical protein